MTEVIKTATGRQFVVPPELEALRPMYGLDPLPPLQKKDPTNPDYYKNNPSGMECIDAIAAAIWSLEGTEAMCTGNAIKYLWRWKQKGGVEDLKKCMWYIQWMIDELAKDAPNRA